MAATTANTGSHAACEESSPVKDISPTKAHKSPVVPEMTVSPSKQAAGDSSPAEVQLEGSSKENGDHIAAEPNSTDDVKVSENGTEQPLEPSGEVPPSKSPEKSQEDVKTSESLDKAEDVGAQTEATGEGQQHEERKQQEEDHGHEGKDHGHEGKDGHGSAAENEASDIGQKMDLIKLDVSPKVQSATKSTCAAV